MRLTGRFPIYKESPSASECVRTVSSASKDSIGTPQDPLAVTVCATSWGAQGAPLANVKLHKSLRITKDHFGDILLPLRRMLNHRACHQEARFPEPPDSPDDGNRVLEPPHGTFLLRTLGASMT